MADVLSAGAMSPAMAPPSTKAAEMATPKNRRTVAQALRRAASAAVAWLPFAAILGITVYAWYVLAIMLCFQTLIPVQTTRAVLYLVFGTLLTVLALGHFVAAAFVCPGSPLDYRRVRVVTRSPEDVPDGHSSEQQTTAAGDTADDVNRRYEHFVVDEKHRRIVRVSRDRYCAICSVAKPPRAHHCSTCNTCVLRMDHHCPWINNCVGIRNHKLFMLILFWAMAATGLYTGAMLHFLTNLPDRPDGSVAFRGLYVNFIVVCALSVILGTAAFVLFAYHVRLLLVNRTTIEQLDRPDAIEAALETHTSRREAARNVDAYNLGAWRNVQQVLGSSPFLWLVPVPAGADRSGFVFPKRASA